MIGINEKIVYDSQPASAHESYTGLRATLYIYGYECAGAPAQCLRSASYTELPKNAVYFQQDMEKKAKEWMEELTYFFSILPKDKILQYEPPVRCAPVQENIKEE